LHFWSLLDSWLGVVVLKKLAIPNMWAISFSKCKVCQEFFGKRDLEFENEIVNDSRRLAATCSEKSKNSW